MPKTLENYSQEVGRAGRDGLRSDCHMFLCATDLPALEGFARGDTCAKRDIELWIQEVATKELHLYTFFKPSTELIKVSSIYRLKYYAFQLYYRMTIQDNILRDSTNFTLAYYLSK